MSESALNDDAPNDDLSPVAVVMVVTDQLRPGVLALGIGAEQAQFAGKMPELLYEAEEAAESEALAVVVDSQVVGYYRLDFAPGAVALRNFGRPAVGLRGFMIDERWQGRGIGKAAMHAMTDDLRARHPEIRLLALSVNIQNPGARRVYLRAGFADHGELYLGGSAGPQHVMVRDL